MSQSQLPLETLIAILILLFYTISAPLFEKYHFHYMHESGLCMIIGIVISVLASIISPEHNFAKYLKFDSEIFFTFILPPIIFAAGYNLRRRSFFKYFLYIFLFGVVGTIVTFSIVCPLTYLANKNQMFTLTFGKEIDNLAHGMGGLSNSTHNSTNNTNLSELKNSTDSSGHYLRILTSEDVFEHPIPNENHDSPSESLENSNNSDQPSSIIRHETIIQPEPAEVHDEYILNFSLREILLFSSVIAATDTVAALTFIKEENEPKLFAILFGEGVINDAVCIVLYGIIRDFTNSNQEFTSKTPFKMLGSFFNMIVYSLMVGAAVGCLSSVFLKKLKHIKLNRVQECSIIIFFAFISYTLTEEMGLSPIIALLFTGIFMSHYTFYNLSFQAREESSVVSRIMSNIAEAFVFTYLGLTVIQNASIAFSLSFFCWELLFVILGRITAIYGISYVIDLFKIRSFRIKNSHKGIMSCAGSIRGAIAFGLAISIDTNNRINKEVIISSTLSLVFFTTIVFGALMPMFIKFFTSLDAPEKNNQEGHNYVELDTLSHAGVEFDYLHPNFTPDPSSNSKETDLNKLKERLSYWLGTYWVNFDNVYMKPKLIHNWPDVLTEHEEVSKVVKDVIKEFKEEKKLEKNTNDPSNYKQQFETDYLDTKNSKRHKEEEEDYRRMSRDEIMYEENQNATHENYDTTPKTKTTRRIHTTE